MKRNQILKKIEAKFAAIKKLRDQILELQRENVLFSDKNQQFVEVTEDVLISGRPKKYEQKLIGRVHWKEKFMDEDQPNKPIIIERTQIVRINGEWI